MQEYIIEAEVTTHRLFKVVAENEDQALLLVDRKNPVAEDIEEYRESKVTFATARNA